MATDRVVHLLSADSAFYENRDKAAGLADALHAEVMTAKKDIQIHSSLRHFLAVAESGAAEIDETAIGDAITKAIMDQARQIAAEDRWQGTTFSIRKAHRPRISGMQRRSPRLSRSHLKLRSILNGLSLRTKRNRTIRPR
jgi:hypothetical protein